MPPQFDALFIVYTILVIIIGEKLLTNYLQRVTLVCMQAIIRILSQIDDCVYLLPERLLHFLVNSLANSSLVPIADCMGMRQ